MSIRKLALSAALLATPFGLCSLTGTVAEAQVSVGINIGAAPVCPYGYFDYAPYSCAPNGYYGPEWFNGGAFIGAGPWFRGPANFHGNVNNHFDPQHGYHGAMPAAHSAPAHPAHAAAFHGNEVHDGHGAVGGAPHGGPR